MLIRYRILTRNNFDVERNVSAVMRTRTLIIWSTKRNATKNAGEIHLKYVAEAGEPIFTVPDS